MLLYFFCLNNRSLQMVLEQTIPGSWFPNVEIKHHHIETVFTSSVPILLIIAALSPS